MTRLRFAALSFGDGSRWSGVVDLIRHSAWWCQTVLLG